MEDLYYSKALDQHFPTRLDILLYAHDGRGLGHASRTIGIGMALKRLYPNLRVLFVTGAAISQALIGQAKLDWIKLPSYASKIEDGVSTGVNGPANFYKSVLGNHRAQMLRQIVTSFKPKCVLADHSPIGKREELVPALKASQSFDTKWILGLRAIIGNPKGFWSDHFKTSFKTYYHSIFWYGDEDVLGSAQIGKIQAHFDITPHQMGYVSRLYETKQLIERSQTVFTGTISLPWLSQKSQQFILALKAALSKRNVDESWKIFINNQDLPDLKKSFSSLPHVDIEPVGEGYASTILRSKTAIIYGGYNSLMDVCAAGVPSIVVMREMKDKEQDEHIQKLIAYSPDTMRMVEESKTTADELQTAIDSLLQRPKQEAEFNIQGSTHVATALVDLLQGYRM